MASETVPSTASLLASRVKLPQHVVHRAFPSETVVLNLHTGRYHGLNPTAGRMLVALEKARCVRDAASVIAEQYGQSRELVERDVCELCTLLLSRELIELDRPTSS
jgi:Coenzyme PQQ synthesis protein D (PqqD)